MSTLESIDRPAQTPPTGAFRLERDGDLAVLWFDLPGEKVNKFSSSVIVEFDRLVDEIAAMKDLAFLVVTSAKPGIFIAGADVSEFTNATSVEQAREFIAFGQRTFSKFEKLPQITVAAINGASLGGGTELALVCDWRVMSEHPKATIGLPEVQLGILPAWGGTTRLPRLVGLPAALDMILTGKNLDAKRAKRAGLVDETAHPAILLDVAKAFARKQGRKRGTVKNTHFYLEGNPLGRRVVFGRARKGVMKTTRGHYPAPLKVLEVMETGFAKGRERGFAAEADAASRLIMTDIAQNLVRLFFLRESAKKDRAVPPKEIRTAAVLGAGLMGGGIAQIIADKAEIPVRMKDINWQALAGGLKAASKVWKKKLDRGRIKKTDMAVKQARISTTLDWSGFSGVDLVIEAVVESLEVKQNVLAEFEAVALPNAIFATNTSTIPITQIAARAAHPENVVGMHFFSPVDRMPLLEVIAGKKTSEQTLSTAVAFGRKLGKTVVVCKDGPGFIVNRVLAPYINEAGLLLGEGNSIESIDKAMVDFGMPMGPLELLDEVGIDIAAKAAHILVEAFGERMQPSASIEKLLADNRFGKKNGRGVYVWKDGKRTGPDPTIYPLVGLGKPKGPGNGKAMAERMVLAMINEASRILDERIVGSAAELDLAMIFGTGFPPFRGGPMRYADALGIPYVVGRLSDLEEKLGARFAPSAPLRAMAAAATSFDQAYSRK
ncbi:MAG: 3-hydroxyacyl-CoA dehydrogenase NAD-binding domain-containing protein [Thermoanaerobaculia bacterium]